MHQEPLIQAQNARSGKGKKEKNQGIKSIFVRAKGNDFCICRGHSALFQNA